MKNDDSVHALIEKLENGSVDERQDASIDLWRSNAPEVINALVGALKDANVGVRRRAALTIGRHCEKSVIATSALIERAIDESENEEVRERAIDALSKIGGTDTTPVLMSLLHNPIDSIREKSCMAVGELGYSGANDRLRQLAINDSFWAVRWAAAVALWQLRAPDASAILTIKQDDMGIPEEFRNDIPELLAELAEDTPSRPEGT